MMTNNIPTVRLRTHSKQLIPLALSPIAAGVPLEASEDFGKLDVAELITGGREGFAAWRVTGDSDMPVIQPGYVIFVDTYAAPRNGSMVAAMINGLVCVKRFEHTPSKLRLVSRNEAYAPRDITPRDSFQILGVVKSHLAIYS